MISDAVCQVCGVKDNLMLCSRCRQVFYCSKEHQIADWKRHKKNCCSTSVLPSPTSKPDCFSDLSCLKNATVSSQSAPRNNCKFVKNIAQKQTDRLDISNINNSNMPLVDYEKPAHTVGNIAYDHLTEICLASLSKHKSEREELGIIDEVCRNVIQDMDSYGVCVVDNFLGKERGERVLREVKDMYSKGLFQDGQLVSNKANKDLKTIRSDRITWIDGTEPDCSNIDMLISEVDTIILKSNKMENNGKMGDFVINGRTKAMVACYPGDGAHYVKHVDNPNKDGRCITAIYYLNPEWDTERDGGLLRIFPEGWEDQVADIAPEFDRILFFWSDRRNPHEVQPSYKTRYAITLWYFDAAERKEACNLYTEPKRLILLEGGYGLTITKIEYNLSVGPALSPYFHCYNDIPLFPCHLEQDLIKPTLIGSSNQVWLIKHQAVCYFQ